MSPNIFVWGLKPSPLGRHFWHPKNPLSKENSVKPAPLGAGRGFLWIFMIMELCTTTLIFLIRRVPLVFD